MVVVVVDVRAWERDGEGSEIEQIVEKGDGQNSRQAVGKFGRQLIQFGGQNRQGNTQSREGAEP